jgi:hypothetical protein
MVWVCFCPDIVTAVGWQQELLGRPSCGPWQLLLKLGRQLGEEDHYIMAALKLLQSNFVENKHLLQDVIDKRDWS